MYQFHVLPHPCEFGIAVIEELVAEPVQRVALYKTDMSERVQRIGALVEIGAVAIHECFLVAENHVAVQYLCVRNAVLVEIQVIRLLQIDHRLGAYAQ